MQDPSWFEDARESYSHFIEARFDVSVLDAYIHQTKKYDYMNMYYKSMVARAGMLVDDKLD